MLTVLEHLEFGKIGECISTKPISNFGKCITKDAEETLT